MKLLRTTLALAFLSCTSFSFAEQQQEFAYRQELKDLKTNPQFKIIFNEDSNAMLRAVNRDVETYKQLTPLERLTRFAFLALNVIVVTPEAMPKLYSYVSDLCLAHDVALPTIFLTIDEKGFFNAAAQKLLTSTGGIVIGQELLNKTTDAELEAVIAHEIGHIKHNHVNKMLAIMLPTYIATVILTEKYYPYKGDLPRSFDIFLKSFIASNTGLLVMNCIVNKRFEKQADEFAYKVAGHGHGLIEFFEHLQKRTQAHEDDFDTVAQLLTDSKSKLDPADYIDLCMGYYLAKFGNSISKARRWIYYYTRYGAHPAPEARIAAAQAYLEEAALQ